MDNFIRETKELKNKEVEARLFASSIGNAVQDPLLILDDNFHVLVANNYFQSTFKLNEENIVGRLIFELQKNSTGGDLKSLINTSEDGGENIEHIILNPFEVDSRDEFSVKISTVKGKFEEELIFLSFKPNSKLPHGKRFKQNLQSFNNILAHAPAMICTIKGPDHIFEVANENYLDLIGRRDILGKPVREVLPEAENQGFLDILDNVYKTGTPFIGNELLLKVDIGENESKNSYLNFVYQPTTDENGQVNGIFVHAIDVTEQVVARKELEESGLQLRNLIDTLPAIIWIGDVNGQSTYLNKNWFEYTGQTKEEAKGIGWLNATHPDDREKALKIIKEAHAAKIPFSVYFRIKNKENEYRWVIDKGTPKFDVRGEFQGMVGTVLDVHEEKLKEQLIKENEHRIRTIVEESTTATSVYVGPEMRIEMANDEMVRIMGKSRNIIGMTFNDALPELKGLPYSQFLQKVYATGEIFSFKEEMIDFVVDNEIRTGYYNFSYKPLRNEFGEIYGVLNTAIDVTEMVKSRMLLKESESHFRQMANLMPDKVTNTDAAGNSIYFNQNWVEFTGLSRENLIEGGWLRFIHPQEKEKFIVTWQKSLNTGSDFEMELRLLNKTGKYKWHLSRAEAVLEKSGKIKMWIGTNTEIQKIKEEEKRKEDFLKMVSHELKTPITSMKGYVQLLLSLLQNRKDSSSMPIKPSLERINHQINRLTRLISEMLDLTRIEENKLQLRKETFNINDLIEETVQDINYTNTQHQIEIKQEFNCDVYADKDRIGQVLINFITNAIKYSPNNQKIVVSVTKATDNQVAVSVRDQGIGIESKNHKKIFKRFYRIGGKSEETYSGFGIGLYLANEVIQRHNGTISLDSNVGEGSNFTFTLSIASGESE